MTAASQGIILWDQDIRMEPALASDIASFYKLKQAYEERRTRQKQRIRQDASLTKEQKRQKVLAIKVPCPSCGKSGGATFNREGNKLLASCDSSGPCDLSMRVEIGVFADVRTLAKDAATKLTSLENRVIRLKLGVVLGYLTSEEAREEFESLRAGVKQASESVADLDARAIRVVGGAANAKALAVAESEFQEALAQSRELANAPDANVQAQVHALVTLNIETITPVAERIRQLRYVVNRVLARGQPRPGENILIQEPYTLASLQVRLSSLEPMD